MPSLPSPASGRDVTKARPCDDFLRELEPRLLEIHGLLSRHPIERPLIQAEARSLCNALSGQEREKLIAGRKLLYSHWRKAWLQSESFRWGLFAELGEPLTDRQLDKLCAAIVALVCIGATDSPDEFADADFAGAIMAIEKYLRSRGYSTVKAAEGPDSLVTLVQMAAIVHRTKRCLEEYKGRLPKPKVTGGGGKPHEWLWSDVRPKLEKLFGRELPEIFPGDRFIRR
jgi:hypothetical protein